MFMWSSLRVTKIEPYALLPNSVMQKTLKQTMKKHHFIYCAALLLLACTESAEKATETKAHIAEKAAAAEVAAANTTKERERYQLELIDEKLNAACPQGNAVSDYAQGGDPIGFDEYNTYFSKATFILSKRIRRQGVDAKSIPEADRIHSRIKINSVSIKTFGRHPVRFENLTTGSIRQATNSSSFLRAVSNADSVVAVWREDCRGFLRVESISDHLYYNPSIYQVQYDISEKKQLPSLRGLSQSVDSAAAVENSSAGETVVVMQRCRLPIVSNNELVCEEHNLDQPQALPRELFYSNKRPLVFPQKHLSQRMTTDDQ